MTFGIGVRDELPAMFALGGMFITVDAVVGHLLGDGLWFGATVGLLLYGVVLAVEQLVDPLARMK